MHASCRHSPAIPTHRLLGARASVLFGSLAGALSLTVLSALSPSSLSPRSLSPSSLLQIQSAQAQDLPPIPIQFNPDTLINPGRPGGRRRGGGSRGICQADKPLTAIAYAESTTTEELGVTSTSERVGSLTTQAAPTLLFYIPQPIEESEESAISLIVKNSRNDVLFQGEVTGETDGNGIISVPMPTSLEANEPYHWFLTLECDESESTTVDGWVERRTTSEDLSRTFSQANARNRVALYANYGFVQDSLSELAALRLANPDDEILAQEWRGFLNTLGLTDLTDAPLLDCCQVADAEVPNEEVPDEEVPDADMPDAEVPDEEVPETIEPEELEQVTPEPEEVPERRTILQRARDRG